MNRLIGIATILIPVLISGCSSSTPNTVTDPETTATTTTTPSPTSEYVQANPSTDAALEYVRFLGEVYSFSFDQESNMSIRGNFFKYSEAVNVESLKGITGYAQLDTPSCTIKDRNSTDDNRESIPDTIDVNWVSAGENLILTSDTGTFADIQKFENDIGFPSPVYGNSVDLPLFPENLQLSIPGDEFVAFDVTMPYVPKLDTAFNIGDIPISLNTEITWTAGTDTDAVISLQLSDDLSTVNIKCVSDDSGTFTLPQNVLDYFDSDQPMLFQSMTRSKTTFHYKGDAMLITHSQTNTTF